MIGDRSTVTIIDSAHDVALPAPPPFGEACAAAVNPATQRAYVAVCSSGNVVVVPNDGVALLRYPGALPQQPISVTPVPTGQVMPMPTAQTMLTDPAGH